jgi:hypothetical protein
VLLTVSDHGIGADLGGLATETIWQAPGFGSGFGSGIVAELAERLGGFVTRAGGPTGTTATFRIPAGRSMQ